MSLCLFKHVDMEFVVDQKIQLFDLFAVGFQVGKMMNSERNAKSIL